VKLRQNIGLRATRYNEKSIPAAKSNLTVHKGVIKWQKAISKEC
jgi:hypothetical protein